MIESINVPLTTLEKSHGVVQTPTEGGKVAYRKINDGDSIWVTINGNHVLLTRGGKRFFADFEKMKQVIPGYQGNKHVRAMSHAGFTIDQLEDRQKQRKEEDEKKPPKEMSKEKKERTEKQKAIKKEIGTRGEERSKMESEVSKESGIGKRVDSEYEKIRGDMEKHIDSSDLSAEDKKTAKEEIEAKLKKKLQRSMISDVFSDDKEGKGSIEFKKPDFSGISGASGVRRAVADAVLHGYGTDDVKHEYGEVKGENKDKLKEKFGKVIEKTGEINKLNRQIHELFGESAKENIIIDNKKLKLSDAEISEAKKYYAEESRRPDHDNMYDMLRGQWDEQGNPRGQAQSNFGGKSEVTSVVEKFTMKSGKGLGMDIGNLVDDMGMEKALQLTAMNVYQHLGKEGFDKFVDDVEEDNVKKMGGIEKGVEDEMKRLKKDLTALGEGKNYKDHELIEQNLNQQRNTLWLNWGRLNGMGEFYTALQAIKQKDGKLGNMQIALGEGSEDEAKAELARILHRGYGPKPKETLQQSAKIVKTSSGKFYAEVPSDFILDRYTKNKELDSASLTKAREQKTKKYDSKNYDLMKEGGVFGDMEKKSGYRLGVHQMQNIEFFSDEGKGRSGICGATTGAGKTAIMFGTHARMKEKNPNHVSLVVAKQGNAHQILTDAEDLTNTSKDVIVLSEDGKTAMAQLKAMEGTDQMKGKMIVMSQKIAGYKPSTGSQPTEEELALAKVAKYASKVLNPDSVLIDEAQEMYNASGEMKGKFSSFDTSFRNKGDGTPTHKVIFTASPMKSDSADIVNMLSWAVGDKDPRFKKRNRNQQRGLYSMNTKYGGSSAVTGHIGVTDFDLGGENDFESKFKNLIESHTTNTFENIFPFKQKAIEHGIKMSDSQKKEYEGWSNLVDGKVEKEFSGMSRSAKIRILGSKFENAKPEDMTIKAIEKSGNRTAIERLHTGLAQMVQRTKYEFLDRKMGADNPKTKAFLENIKTAGTNKRHVVYVTGPDHEAQVRNELKRTGYDMDSVLSLLPNSVYARRDKTGKTKQKLLGKTSLEITKEYKIPKDSPYKGVPDTIMAKAIEQANPAMFSGGKVVDYDDKEIRLEIPNKTIAKATMADREKSGKGGIIFIDKNNASSHNMQWAHEYHSLGAYDDAPTIVQGEGRLSRMSRKKDVGDAYYHRYTYEDSIMDREHQASIEKARRVMGKINPMADFSSKNKISVEDWKKETGGK